MKLVNKLGALIESLRPSLFDLAICGILGISFFANPFIRGSFLVFYSLFLLCVSFCLKPKNQYRSLPLVILLVTSLVMVFIHRPYKIVPGSIMNYYFNVAIMSEGFIYILAGCALYFMIIRYSKNTNFILIAALLAFLEPVRFMLSVGSPVSLGLSLFLATITYLLLYKKYSVVKDICMVGVMILLFNLQFVKSKGTCRPDIWMASLKEIMQHPFLGIGFNYTVMPDGLFLVDKWHWVYRHNDYLYIWTALGIMGFISAVWWTLSCLRQIGKTIYLIPFLFLVLLCNMKEIMLIPERAAIVIVICACCVKATLKKGDGV